MTEHFFQSIFQEENLYKFFGLVCGTFIILLLLGLTDIIIIYRDVYDFWWSLGLVLFPISAFFLLSLLAPAESVKMSQFFWDDRASKTISISGFLLTILSFYKVFSNCIKNNGLIFGILMIFFKVISSVLVLALLLCTFNKLSDKKTSKKEKILTLIIFGLFIFIINRLINGERVLSKNKS